MWRRHTGIELFIGAGKCAPVVNLDTIAVLGLPIALDRLGDFNLELGARGQGSDGGGGHQTEGEEDVLHYRVVRLMWVEGIVHRGGRRIGRAKILQLISSFASFRFVYGVRWTKVIAITIIIIMIGVCCW